MLSRRSLLHLTGGLATFALFGCGSDDDGGGPSTTPPGALPPSLAAYFDQLVVVRDAMRKSPDHTRGRADQVVASRDPSLIHRFVRDEIALLAPHSASDGAESGVRWGIEGVLRGGVGTFRERAELLASLFVRAGLTARVRLGVLPVPVPPEVLYRRRERVFAPPLDAAAMDSLWKLIGKAPPAPLRFDPDGADSKRLAGDLLALLAAPSAKLLAPPEANLVPMVSVMVGGVEKYAFPYGDIELVDAATVSVASDPLAADPPMKVRIALSMSTAAGDVPLIESVYGADTIVGKQVMLRAVPPSDPSTAFGTRASDLHLFVPTLAITSPSSDANAVASSIQTGQAIMDRGALVKEDATGLSVDGVPITPASGPGADGASVANATVAVNAGAFPHIELLLSATDGAGASVPTLAASAIRVGEDGVDQSFLVVENAAPKPRVLLVYDTSASIPAAFADPASRATFGSSLAQALQSRVPGVELQVVGTATDRPALDKWSMPTPAAFGDAIVALGGGGSFVWTGARNAAFASPAVIVLVSDFQADEVNDPTLPSLKAALPLGAPVVAVAVGTSDAATQAEIASLSGGVTLTADTAANVAPIVDAVVAQLAKRLAYPYRLSYRAPSPGAATRQVVVSFPKSPAKAQASYVAPAADKLLPDRGILGLTLLVQIGTDPPIRRTLAGLTLAEAGQNIPLTPEGAAHIRQTLLGTTLLSFEGGAPSESTWADDYLTGHLSTRPLVEAVLARDDARIDAAIANGFSLLPEGLDGLHVPPSIGAPNEPVVMEHALRAAIYQFTRKADGTEIYRSDILQSTMLESTSAAADVSFRQTLEASCRLALGEAAVFPVSTIALLKQVPLVRVASGSTDATIFPDALRVHWKKLLEQYIDFDRLVPSSGVPFAMWAIDPSTGSAFAVLEDGSGGGQNALPPGVVDPNMYDKAFDVGGLIGMGPYFILGKACARVYLRAANELVPGYTGPPYDPKKAGCDLLKDLIKDNAFGRLGAVGGKIVSAADTAREWAKLPDPIPGC